MTYETKNITFHVIRVKVRERERGERERMMVTSGILYEEKIQE